MPEVISARRALSDLNAIWVALVLGFVVVAIYGRTASFDFVRYDDPIYVSKNPLVLHPSREGLVRLWLAPREGLYIPLAYTCYVAIGWAASVGPGSGTTAVDAGAYHVASVALHFACAWMVWYFVRQLIADSKAALMAALLFACHPLQVESVAWISGFSGQLGALLSLIALSLYMRYVTGLSGSLPRDSVHRRTEWLFYGAGTLAFAGALLCKPQAVTVPLVAGFVALLWYGKPLRNVVGSLVPWLAMAAAITLVTSGQQGVDSREFSAPLWMRPFIAGDAITFYLMKLVWPLELAPDYGRAPRLLVEQAWLYMAWLVPATMVAVAAWLRCGKAAWASLGIFVLTLLPVLGFVPFAHQDISTVADRYVYLAMLGPALALAAWLSARRRIVAWGSATIALVVFAALSFVQAGTWRDTRTLADHALAVNDRSWLMRNVKASVLLRDEKPRQAIRQLEIAVEKLPNSAVALHRLAALQLGHGDYDLARANALRANKLRPGQSSILTTLGKIDRAQGHLNRAMETLRRAIDIAPRPSAARIALAQILRKIGRADEAVQLYEAVIEEVPEHAEATTELGILLLAKGDLVRAESLCRRAITLAPDWDVAYVNLGTVLFSSHRYDEAIEAFETALRLQPDAHIIRINLGVALMTSGRLEEAETQLRRAVDELPESAAARYNLAALLVRRERLPEARALLLRALELNPDHQPAQVQLKALEQMAGQE